MRRWKSVNESRRSEIRSVKSSEGVKSEFGKRFRLVDLIAPESRGGRLGIGGGRMASGR